MNWRGENDRPKEASCRAALRRLEEQGVIELPPVREVDYERKSAAEPEPVWPEVKTSLGRLRGIKLVIVDGKDKGLSRLWRSMMKAHHPLSDGPLCGAQIRYLIASDEGFLGGLSFSAAAWRLGARDKWIGWSDGMRAARLSRIVSNSRFLILPSVQVRYLSSHVLGLAAKRLAKDWLDCYGERPVLMETFVDSDRYRGTCYHAANWIRLGMTQGRGRRDRGHDTAVSRKHIFVYPLQRNWKKILNAALELPRIVPSMKRQLPADWAEVEFGQCQLAEPLSQRLITVARDFGARPMANIPQACGSTAKTKAAYRLLAHRDVTFEAVLQPHFAATEQRIGTMRDAVILVPQDTTSLNFTKLTGTDGLGPIGTNAKGAQGLHLHSSLALTEEGIPLGFLDAQCWARDTKTSGKKAKAKRQSLPIEEKESYRWIKSYQAVAAVQKRHPNVTLVSMGDREADIYELFAEAASDPNGPKLLVRAKHDRELQNEQAYLFDKIHAAPIAGYQIVALPRQNDRSARDAKLAIHYAKVTLCPPHDKRHLPSIDIWAVLAKEEGAPDDVEPIKWLVLTTMPVDSFEQANEKVCWYAKRWGIEVFHRTLKSAGCKMEQRRLGHADRLEACLAIDMVIAWKICHLVKSGQEVPDVPCDVFFSELEWKTLCAFSTQNPIPPEAPPSLREATHMLGMLGGYLGRHGDGEPGAQALAIGFQHLSYMTSIGQVLWSFIDHLKAVCRVLWYVIMQNGP
jgi:hypothetical protein